LTDLGELKEEEVFFSFCNSFISMPVLYTVPTSLALC
jgi:hypothetical protein